MHLPSGFPHRGRGTAGRYLSLPRVCRFHEEEHYLGGTDATNANNPNGHSRYASTSRGFSAMPGVSPDTVSPSTPDASSLVGVLRVAEAPTSDEATDGHSRGWVKRDQGRRCSRSRCPIHTTQSKAAPLCTPARNWSAHTLVSDLIGLRRPTARERLALLSSRAVTSELITTNSAYLTQPRDGPQNTGHVCCRRPLPAGPNHPSVHRPASH